MIHQRYRTLISSCLILIFLFSCGRDPISESDDTPPPPSTGDVSWAQTSGPEVSEVRSLMELNGFMFCGTDNGLFITSDSGKSWQPFNAGLQDPSVLSLANDKFGRLYAGTTTGLYRAINVSASWGRQSVTTGSVWEIYEHSSGRIFVGSITGLLRSDELGQNWAKVDSGLGDVSVLSFCEASNGRLFVGTNRDGVFTSSDLGETWQQTALQTQVVFALNCDTTGTVYAGTLGGGLYKSSDLGISWQQFSDPRLPTTVNDIQVLPDNSIFLATEGSGVWKSSDGTNWLLASDSLDVQKINALQVGKDNHLFAGTANGYVYRTQNRFITN